MIDIVNSNKREGDIMYLLRKLLNPTIYQGKYKRKNYFEGWYFKIIDVSKKHVLAVIPGISYDEHKKDCHAFVQVIDAYTCKVEYFRYPLSLFRFNERQFEIEVGDNYFSNKKIVLDLGSVDDKINGVLHFESIVPYPRKILQPGIMGPFSFMPFMECYHGIVNIHHEISGTLNKAGNVLDFTNGYGYIEKDWGKSFPEAWIWMQCNHFDTQDVSLMFSVAKIPWMSRHFIGFLCFLRIQDTLFLFTTYTNAKIHQLTHKEDTLTVILKDKKFKLEFTAEHADTGTLKAPKNGLMHREIEESITALVSVTLLDNEDNIIYEGEGTNVGLETVNEKILLAELNKKNRH